MRIDGVDTGTLIGIAAREALREGKWGRTNRQFIRLTRSVSIVTVPATSRFPVGSARRGGLVHRVAKACSVWTSFEPVPRCAALWKCNAISNDAVFGPAAEDRQLCSRCDFAGADHASLAVYFAERDGLIKIGCSSNVLARTAGLEARLLAVQAGGFGLEKELHERFAGDRRYGEWFTPGAALMAHVASLGKAVA